MENSGCETPISPFPRRMFAYGDEPVGVRVTPYHKASCISKILNALEAHEIEVIRESPFGRLIEIADKPAFSGRLGRFLVSRQLKVSKKHEVWFLFAGKPVRFSIREFALVTGLNCRNYPPHTKKKSKKNINIAEKPYWGELFGTMKDVPVSYVISMLKKKTVTDAGIRIKYAFLALLASVILPTSHCPRITQQLGEKIKDLDKFFAYPWGRASFEMLMSSMKERNEVSLSQNTIAFKGFVMAIQLVMIEAVPSLTGVVIDGDSSGSEADSEGDDANVDDDREGKKSINPGHVRDIDSACKVNVVSIISTGVELTNVDPDISLSEDEEDVHVDNLVRGIQDGFNFSNSHFIGGATRADVSRMREEAKRENLTRKNVKTNLQSQPSVTVDPEYLASIVQKSVSAEISLMREQVKVLSSSISNQQNIFQTNIQGSLANFQREIVKLINIPCTRPHFPPAPPVRRDHPVGMSTPTSGGDDVNASTIIHNAMCFATNDTSETNNVTLDGLHAPEEGNTGADKVGESGDVLADIRLGEDRDEITGDEEWLASPTHHVAAKADVRSGEDRDESPGNEEWGHPNITPGNNPSPDSPAVLVNNHNPSGADLAANNPATILVDDTANNVDPALDFPNPTFSIGLTQEDPQLTQAEIPEDDNDDQPMDEDAPHRGDFQEVPDPPNRKSKRAKVVPRALVGEYECDKRFLTRVWEAHVNAIRSTPNVDYATKLRALSEKLKYPILIDIGKLTLTNDELSSIVSMSSHLPPKVVDVLIDHTRAAFLSNSEHSQSKNYIFLDTQFVSLLAKTFPKFSKAQKKESFRFPPSLSNFLVNGCPIYEANRFYFPFNFDKNHWVGVCVDCSAPQVTVLDCNNALRTDAMITKELRFISVMFPYLLRQAGKQLTAKEMKTFTIERPRTIPQNTSNFESGITAILLIQAHAVGGVEVCKCITPYLLEVEAQRIAVLIYEENVGVL